MGVPTYTEGNSCYRVKLHIMKSPILFIIFKRADTTQQVFERIREAHPPKLYIAADGPHKDNPEEIEKCKAARRVVEKIDWPCEVYRLYRDDNLGCGEGVSSAITWFLEQEEEGIIIEDDVLPHLDFFRFCDEMLERYRDIDQVKCICGRNKFFKDVNYPYSYYFSHYTEVWGWATWRRTWNEYDKSLKSISKEQVLEEVKALPVNKKSKQSAIRIFDTMTSDNPIDTWDYQLGFSVWHHGGLNIIPINNLCGNLGIGHADAVHTLCGDDKLIFHTVRSCYPLTHPPHITDCPRLERIAYSENGDSLLEVKKFACKLKSRAKRVIKKLLAKARWSQKGALE